MKLPKILKPFFDIRRGEWERVILLFIYFLLTIASYYIVKTCSRAFFISRLGADMIPYVNLANAVLTGVLVYFYARIAHQRNLHSLVNGSLFVLLLTTVLFWWGFQFEAGWIAFLFWIWVTLFSAITVTQFWTVTNDIFEKDEATRVYGIVGSGGLIGGIVGSYVAGFFAQSLGTRNLLLVAGGFLLLCMAIVYYLSHTETGKQRFAAATKGDLDEDEIPHLHSGLFRLIRHSRYLQFLLLTVFLIKFCSTLTEWQYNKVIEIFITPEGEDATASFVGQIFGHLSIVALIIQFFFTGYFLNRFGGGGTLLLLPAGLILAEAFILFTPGLLTGALLKITDGSLRYSINQSAKEYVYLPMSRFVRRKIKPFIDMFVYQASKGIAAGFILLSNSFVFEYLSKRHPEYTEQTKVIIISAVVLPALLIWFLIVLRLSKTHEFRKSMAATKPKPVDLDSE